MKEEMKLVEMCQVFAEQVIGESVSISAGWDEPFRCYVPTSEEDFELFEREVMVELKPAKQEIIKEHQRFERLTYGDVDYGLDYFTYSFLHELGHHMTLAWFAKDAPERDYQDFISKEGGSVAEYKSLPAEMAADLWSLRMFIPHNLKKVREFDREIQRLLEIIRRRHDRK